MKTDRELLELAAKAAGIEGRFIERCPEDGHPTYSCGIGRGVSLWNPLNDDGAALRLAVKLWLDLNINDGQCDVFSSEGFYNCRDDDTAAATRRAIVRAAAAIGEAMP